MGIIVNMQRICDETMHKMQESMHSADQIHQNDIHTECQI